MYGSLWRWKHWSVWQTKPTQLAFGRTLKYLLTYLLILHWQVLLLALDTAIPVKCIIHSFTSALESATCVSISVGVPWHLFPSRGTPATFIFDAYGIPVLLWSLSSTYTAPSQCSSHVLSALVGWQERAKKSALATLQGSPRTLSNSNLRKNGPVKHTQNAHSALTAVPTWVSQLPSWFFSVYS